MSSISATSRALGRSSTTPIVVGASANVTTNNSAFAASTSVSHSSKAAGGSPNNAKQRRQRRLFIMYGALVTVMIIMLMVGFKRYNSGDGGSSGTNGRMLSRRIPMMMGGGEGDGDVGLLSDEGSAFGKGGGGARSKSGMLKDAVSVCKDPRRSASFFDVSYADDHRGGERLNGDSNNNKKGGPSDATTRLSLDDGDKRWEGKAALREKDMAKLGNEAPLSHVFGPSGGAFKRKRERYLTPDVSSERGGEKYYEHVVEGTIGIAPDSRTNAIMWGDSKQRPAKKDQAGLGGVNALFPRKPIRTVVKSYTDEELLAMHHTMDIVISYVNGSDGIHRFHKMVLNNIVPGLRDHRGGGWFPVQSVGKGKEFPLNNLTQLELYLSGAGGLTTTMDREHDELRYNIRSLHKNMRWHCGRLIILSDANTPNWLNRARNFFMTSLPRYPGGKAHPDYGKKCLNADTRRITVVHQDAILPMDARYTFNTNTIELYIYRIRRLSNLYVHYNDDYLTRKRTRVTDFVNSKGGPILRFENDTMSRDRYPPEWARTQLWVGSVRHTNGFVEEVLGDNIVDDDYYEPNTKRRVMAEGGDVERGFSSDRRLMRIGPISEPDHRYAFSDMRMSPYWPRPRFFLKHAPFVMCRNMFRRHLLPYYANRMTRSGLQSNQRNVNDYIPPQVHHAFITDVPWAASASFGPDHMTPGMRRAIDGALLSQWEHERLLCGGATASHDDDETTIHLDNNDGCAPALLQIGSYASSHVITFTDDLNRNGISLRYANATDPLFLTLNDNGYNKREVEDQVVALVSSLYPHSAVCEDPRMAIIGARSKLANSIVGGGGTNALPAVANNNNAGPTGVIKVNFPTMTPTAAPTNTSNAKPTTAVVAGTTQRKLQQQQQEASTNTSSTTTTAQPSSTRTTMTVASPAKPAAPTTTAAPIVNKWPRPVEEDPYFKGVTKEEREDVMRTIPDEEGVDGSQYPYTANMQLYYERRYKQFNQLPLLLVIESSLPRAVMCALLRSLSFALPDHEGNVGIIFDGHASPTRDQTTYAERAITYCRSYSLNVRTLYPNEKLGEAIKRMKLVDGAAAVQHSIATEKGQPTPYPTHSKYLSSVDAIMIRIPCMTALGQTLALEDFAERTVGSSRLLYLEAPCPTRDEEMEPSDLDPTAVNWVLAPSVWALLQSYPIPYRKYEPSEELLYGY